MGKMMGGTDKNGRKIYVHFFTLPSYFIAVLKHGSR